MGREWDERERSGRAAIVSSDRFANPFVSAPCLSPPPTPCGFVWVCVGLCVSPPRSMWRSTAAAFLKKFVPDDCTWAHVDIAGPAMPSETRSFVHRGGSGFGAALVAQYLLRFGDQPLPRADSDDADLPADPAVPSDLRVLFGPRPEGLELELAR